MPLSLDDLETAAFACRAMASQESSRAAAMENPSVRATLEKAAKRYGDLARRFETALRVRKKGPTS